MNPLRWLAFTCCVLAVLATADTVTMAVFSDSTCSGSPTTTKSFDLNTCVDLEASAYATFSTSSGKITIDEYGSSDCSGQPANTGTVLSGGCVNQGSNYATFTLDSSNPSPPPGPQLPGPQPPGPQGPGPEPSGTPSGSEGPSPQPPGPEPNGPEPSGIPPSGPKPPSPNPPGAQSPGPQPPGPQQHGPAPGPNPQGGSPPNGPAPSPSSSGTNVGLVVGSICGVLAVMGTLAAVLFFPKKTQAAPKPSSEREEAFLLPKDGAVP